MANERLRAAGLLAVALAQAAGPASGPPREVAAAQASLAAACGLAAGLALLRMRERPAAVLAATAGLYAAQVALTASVVPAAVAVAAYGAARYGSAGSPVPTPVPLAALVAAVLGVAGTVLAAGSGDLSGTYAVLVLGGTLAGVVAAARAQAAETLRREAAAAERLRIARDLHDVVGHGMAAITVQAGAGRAAVAAGASSDAARAFAAIETTGRGVLRDVRWMVGLLREDGARPSLADIPGLVEAARSAGLDARAEVAGGLAEVAPAVGEAGYRIVQESLTNAMRHAGAVPVEVRVAVRDGSVRLAVHDSGTAGAAPAEGNGLRGLRERAAAVGGSVTWGPAPGGGWSVVAQLPAGRAR